MRRRVEVKKINLTKLEINYSRIYLHKKRITYTLLE